jgi:GrpB protein
VALHAPGITCACLLDRLAPHQIAGRYLAWPRERRTRAAGRRVRAPQVLVRAAPNIGSGLHIRCDGEFSQQAALLFRDQLRSDDSALKRYEDVKRELARRERAGGVTEYADRKSDVVWALIRPPERTGAGHLPAFSDHCEHGPAELRAGRDLPGDGRGRRNPGGDTRC